MKSELIKEVWRPVRDYEDRYEISSFGRIRSVYRIEDRISVYGKKYKLSKKPVYRKIHKDKNGYMRVILKKNSIGKSYCVHRLVWEAFNGPIPEGMQVNHINEDKTDNRLENLNLMTPKENTNWGTGIKRRAERQKNDHRSKAVAQLDNNGQIIKVYPSINEMHRQTGYSMCSIGHVCKHKPNYNTAYGYRWEYL